MQGRGIAPDPVQCLDWLIEAGKRDSPDLPLPQVFAAANQLLSEVCDRLPAAKAVGKLQSISSLIGADKSEIETAAPEKRHLVYNARMMLAAFSDRPYEGNANNLGHTFALLESAAMLAVPDFPARKAHLGISQIVHLFCVASEKPEKRDIADYARGNFTPELVEQLSCADIALYIGATCDHYAHACGTSDPDAATSFRTSADAYFTLGAAMEGEAATLCASELAAPSDCRNGVECANAFKQRRPPLFGPH